MVRAVSREDLMKARADFIKMIQDAEQQGLDEKLAAASSEQERETIRNRHLTAKLSSKIKMYPGGE